MVQLSSLMIIFCTILPITSQNYFQSALLEGGQGERVVSVPMAG